MRSSRNAAKVDHWQNSPTALLDIEPRLRKVMGYRHLPKTRELKIDTTTSKKEVRKSGAVRDVGTGDVWIWNTERDSRTRLTETATFNSHPVWSPDGATVAFASIRGGRLQIYSRPVDLSQETEPLLPTEIRGIPGAWTPDGRTLVYQDYSSDRDIWMWSASADPAPLRTAE